MNGRLRTSDRCWRHNRTVIRYGGRRSARATTRKRRTRRVARRVHRWCRARPAGRAIAVAAEAAASNAGGGTTCPCRAILADNVAHASRRLLAAAAPVRVRARRRRCRPATSAVALANRAGADVGRRARLTGAAAAARTDDVERRLQAVARRRSLALPLRSRRRPPSRGGSINMITTGTGPVPGDALVADARRRADRDRRAVRRVRLFRAAPRTMPRCSASVLVDAVHRPDAQSGRRRALSRGATRRASTSTAMRCVCRRPEGRCSRRCAIGSQPRVGFNLHNQSWTTSVGDPPQAARRFRCSRSPTTRWA